MDVSSCVGETTFLRLDEDTDAITAYFYAWFGTDQPLDTLNWRRSEGASDEFGEFEIIAYEVTP